MTQIYCRVRHMINLRIILVIRQCKIFILNNVKQIKNANVTQTHTIFLISLQYTLDGPKMLERA